MAYLIYFEGNPEFQIKVDRFKDQLLSNWPSMEFERVKVPNDTFLLHWKIEFDDDPQLGALHGDSQTISIDGFPPSVTKFTIWYRKIVPSMYQLYLSHDSADESIEITPDSTAEELLERLNDM
jgi:hypothetical protein